MMGTKIRNFVPLPDLSLAELGPKDNFYRRLEETLELSFFLTLSPRAGPSSCPLHPPSGKRRSQKFALTEYSESRFEGLKEASTTPEIAARIPTLVGSTTRGRSSPCYTRQFTASWWSEGSASSRSRGSSWCIAWCPPPRASATTTLPASSTPPWA